MSKAFKCDGCGKFVSGQPSLKKNYPTIDYHSNRDQEYCLDCAKRDANLVLGE